MLGQIAKKNPKMKFKKFVKLTDHTCAYNDLTNFETGNGSYVNLQKLVKSFLVSLFSASLSNLEPLCNATARRGCFIE